jgi:hypothetical protein
MIDKFDKYFEKKGEQEPLMNDIETEFIDEYGEKFNPDEWEIDEIISILDSDPSKSEEDFENEIDEAITFDTQVPKDVKRGDHIWITAMIKKKNSSYNNPGRQAVIKVRVIDIYYGLSHLNKVINK